MHWRSSICSTRALSFCLSTNYYEWNLKKEAPIALEKTVIFNFGEQDCESIHYYFDARKGRKGGKFLFVRRKLGRQTIPYRIFCFFHLYLDAYSLYVLCRLLSIRILLDRKKNWCITCTWHLQSGNQRRGLAQPHPSFFDWKNQVVFFAVYTPRNGIRSRHLAEKQF